MGTLTDRMPMVLVLGGSVLATLGLLIKPDLEAPRRAFWVTAGASLLVYALYLLAGETWLPYG